MSTQAHKPKIPSDMGAQALRQPFSKIAVHTKQHRIHIPVQTRTQQLHARIAGLFFNYVSSTSLDIALKVSSSEKRTVILLMEIVQVSPCGFVCESEEIFGLENRAILRLDRLRKLIFLLFSKTKGFLREQFTSDYLST